MRNARYFIYIIPILLVVFVLSSESCKHYPDDIPMPDSDTTNNDTTGPSNCDPDSVYFVNDILPLITSSCASTGCHDDITQENGVTLTNYNNIMSTGKVKPFDPADSELYDVITETQADAIMPPPPSFLLPEQIGMIRKWILQGANNNKCTDCDSTDITFSNQVISVLNTNCTPCHNATSASGGVSLVGYSNVKIQVDNGNLLGTMSHAAGYKPMPTSGKVTDCSLQIITKWINDGAPNN